MERMNEKDYRAWYEDELNEKIKQLEEENKMLKSDNKRLREGVDAGQKIVEDLISKNKKLKEENERIKKQLSDEQLYNKLCEIDNRCGSDSEARHVEADELLIECLRTLGFNKAMDKYKWMEFRYS